MSSKNFIHTWLGTYILNADNSEDKKVLIFVKDGEYFCNLCKKALNGNEAFVEEHFKGEKHCR